MISVVTLAILSIHPNECWRSVPGGFKGNGVYDAAIDKFAQQECVFVEIGSLMGQSTCYMANSLKHRNISHVKFDVIDYWASMHVTRSDVSFDWLPPHQMKAAQKFGKGEMSMAWHYYMLKTHSWAMIRSVFHGSSTDPNIAKNYDDLSIDFVYLDTAHEASITKQELDLWWPKVKRQGLLCGDDYHPPDGSSTTLNNYAKAVDAWFNDNGIVVEYKGHSQFCVTKI